MADDVVVNGVPIRAIDVGGVKRQIVGIDLGGEGASVPVVGALPISATTLPLPTGAALDATVASTNTEVGGLTETAPASDIASSGLNGRLQRIAQRLTSLMALLPAALGTGGGLKVDGSGTPLPVSGTVAVSSLSGGVTANAGTNLNTNALALDATLAAQSAKLPATLGQALKAASLAVVEPGAATTTRTSVASAVADTALLAADVTRIGATIYNESTAVCYVGYGATAVSLTNYSVAVPALGYLEVPAQFVGCAIRGYWAAANGAARITVG